MKTISSPMKNTSKCQRHPYIKTTVVCQRCQTPICKDCRLEIESAPYCSSYCLRADRIYQFSNRYKKTHASNPLSKEHYSKDLPADLYIDATKLVKRAGNFAALLLISFILIAVRLQSTSSELTRKAEAPQQAIQQKAKTTISKKIKSPKIPASAISISRVKNAGKNLSITFDGGSSDSSASAILDILSKRQIKTTFFLTGQFIKKYPHIVKQMAREGHEVGNHTMSHPHLTTYSIDRKQTTSAGVSYAFLKKEMEETARLFEELTGRKMQPLWRAPFGETNKEILKWAAEIGYRHIAWTVDYKAHQTMDSLDWVTDKNSSLYSSSNEIKEKLLSFADKEGRAEGGIILMHLGTQRKDEIVHEKLGEIIGSFITRGYGILPVSILLKIKGKKGRV